MMCRPRMEVVVFFKIVHDSFSNNTVLPHENQFFIRNGKAIHQRMPSTVRYALASCCASGEMNMPTYTP